MKDKKNFQSGLDAILGGASEETTKQPSKTSKKASSDNVSVCFRCSPDRLAKVREIARMKGVSLKDVMEAAIDVAVERYESKHGVIEIKEKAEQSDIFD